VVSTLVDVIDNEVAGETRHAAIYGLGWHKTAAATAKLQQILDNPLETDGARRQAAQLLGKEFTPGEPVADAAEKATPPGRELKLWERIVQPRDARLRMAALQRVQEMLETGTEVTAALEALAKSREVEFDRQPLIPLARRYLNHEDATLRSQAVHAFSGLGAGSISSKALLALLDEPNAAVRGKVGQTAVALDRKLEQPETAEIVRRLLDDTDRDAVQAIIYALPGLPLSKEVEDRLIELSYDTKLGYDTVYYGLTNRPILRRPVAERLIELAQNSQTDNAGRAVWAMGRTPATDDARPLVVEALQAIVDSQSSGYQYDNAIRGLKLHQQ
jgi:HEAT repeat protein